MPSQTSQTSSKLDALIKILRQEQLSGFDDSTVMGGLDRFLHKWATDLKRKLGKLPSYKPMSPSEREKWAATALALLHPDISSRHRDSPSSKSKPKAKPARKVSSTGLSLDDDVIRLRAVTNANVAKFRRLGLEKIRDMVYLFPRGHNDFANVCKVAELVPGQEQTTVATVWEALQVSMGRRMKSTQAILGDETGNVRVVWFNQPYLAKTFRPGDWLVISGKVRVFNGRKVFESPEYEVLKGQEELVHTGRLVPVYPSVEGLPQRTLRRAVNEALKISVPKIKELLPGDLLHRTGLIGLQNAIQQAHYPDSEADKSAARRRLAFDELLLMQLVVLSHKRAWQQAGEAVSLKADQNLLDELLGALPFILTGAQDRVLREILGDMESDRPMSRLLHGDVGSGKTVVAVTALLVAALSGYQGAFMAPTEILAEQHFISISRLLSALAQPFVEDNLFSIYVDQFPRPISIALLTGSQSKRIKGDLRSKLADGAIDVVIGTHALIQKDVEISRLALAVVDEQHHFGVEQRAALREKGKRPHVLAMSATPIPRSLALTLYGDLDISTLDELPQGREKIKTRSVQPDQRQRAYEFVRKEVKGKRQAFVICPLIEESEAIQAKAAIGEHKRLSDEVFPDLRLGLLHGRMSMSEKQQVMEKFRARDIDILVSTPVVEVGIDVPNATVMLIDGANRFGLAQLHQFRGRVGRGQHQSYCLLLADDPSPEVRERLRVLERTNDGFVVAEEDLKFRGPGDYLGTRQSGLPSLRMARLSDQDILAMARKEASLMLDSDPNLKGGEHRQLAGVMRRYSVGIASEMS